jgi:hypothetical protein
LGERCGFEVEQVWSVTPGGYERSAPTLDTAEYLMVARRRS